MPIAFARVAVHSRSHGHSAVAGAAYRAGQKLLDARTGEIHDYEKREDVLYEKVMLPDGADAKFQDREILWNEVELAEKRKDAQVAKDVLLALPKEVSLEEQVELARNFAHTHFVSKGLAADIAIHNKQDGNPHAHIYITTRRIVGDRLDIKKARDLNPGFSRAGLIAEKDYWGEEWKEFQNRHFQERGLELTVDENHIIPQVHEGSVRGEEAHYLKEENQLRREASVEIALNSPESLLNILATKKEVFSERDIAGLIFKNTDTEEQYKVAYTGLKAHHDLMFLGYGEDGRERYTSTGNYLREVELSDHVDALVLKKTHKVEGSYVKSVSKKYGLTQEQGVALSHIAQSGGVCTVVGRAGTGKTYMLKAVKNMYEQAGFNLIGMAVAGVAAKNLETDTGIKSYTIHSIKKRIDIGSLQLTENDILVMDEAGMTDLNDMADIIFQVKQTGAKVVLVGDHAQLQPVGKGAPFRTILERSGFAEISQVMRQNDPKDCAATIALSRGLIGEAIEHYNDKGQIQFSENEADAITDLVGDWKAHITKENLASTTIAAFTNEEVNALNEKARQELVTRKIVEAKGREFQTEKGKITLAKGDRILFLKNNASIGVNNGDFATVEQINGSMVTAIVGEKTKVTFDAEEYNNFNYGYAATVHKLQGSTLDNVYAYIGSKGWDRYLVYVALSRHKETVKAYVNQENHKDLAELKKNLSRHNFRDSVLDWPLAYALRRGFEPDSTVGRFVEKVLKVKESIKDKWLFVVNYEAYLNRVMHRERLEQNIKRREEARAVAAFVDMHRELGREWSEMNKELTPEMRISEHPNYLATYEKMLVKNQMAHSLYREADKYTMAFDANNIGLEAVGKASKAHENFTRSRSYLENIGAGKTIAAQKLAYEIQTDIKSHYSTLGYLTTKNDMPFWEVVNGIKDNALRYGRGQQLEKLKGVEREAFIVVDRYYWLDKEVRQTWSAVYKNGGLDTLSDQELAAIHKKTAECDSLAYEICKHPKRSNIGLTLYDLELDKLQEFSGRHLNRTKVKELADSSHISKREEMAADILADRRYYRHIHELELDWKELYKEKNAFVHKQKLVGLSSEERRIYRTVIDYRQARISAGMAWSKLIEDQNQGKAILKLRQSLCWKLVETRNALAYDIALDPKKYVPFLKETNLKVEDIEKHAVAYSKHLQRQEEWRKGIYKPKKSAPKVSASKVQKGSQLGDKPYWDYQTINDALIAMGERFYEQVLGFKGKKEGLALAYRGGHALLYSPSGNKAGSWHSFGSGEGGGPVQLLMSSTHGWGLSKEDALKEGAGMAGLSDMQAQTNRKTPQRPQPVVDTKREQQEAEKKERRIAAARYYYQSAKPIRGTIGETYLREVRGIEGDISCVKYHPRIRDSKAVEKANNQQANGQNKTEYVTTYHPGIVVAAFNKEGELTGGQTIILDPKTCDKVDKDTVGAVKRSRGVVKGSAAQIQNGTSNKVIIAEGNETALSLAKAAPDANIYVTLGNIKNAASLEWLAEKHHTKDFYFAADNDGPKGNNLKALREVAKELKYDHDIDCYMALPRLEGKEKIDFNDVLREKGQDGVAKQLADMKLIKVPERKIIVHGEELHDRLQTELGGGLGSGQEAVREKAGSEPDNTKNPDKEPQKPTEAFADKNLEWDKVASIPDARLELILRYRKIAEKREQKERAELDDPIQGLIEDTIKNERVMEQLKAKAPNIAEYFARYSEKGRGKEPSVDWASEKYSAEWDKLRSIDNGEGSLFYLIKFRDIAHKKQEQATTQKGYSSMNDLIKKIIEDKNLFGKVKKESPLLAKMFQSHAKGMERFRGKVKTRGRDR